ncbi:hypothetical protein ACFW0T_02570, partial [Streptomyces sp. NPDC058989]
DGAYGAPDDSGPPVPPQRRSPPPPRPPAPRLAFGDIWLTREGVGSAEVSARWPQVRRLEIERGAVRLDIDGTWHTLSDTPSTIRNLFVLRVLVEHFRTDGGR